MILVTGGTGFIGRNLIRRLTEAGYSVRVLLRPSPTSPRLPRGSPIDVVVSGLQDTRGVRAAMKDVRLVYHLAGGEWRGAYADLEQIDIRGTQTVVDAARSAGVERVFLVSHLGADRASAYPVMKAKAIAEEFLKRSGVPYTIFRSALVFGPEDGFTTGLAKLLHALPVFFLPGEGDTLMQPISVDDLVMAMIWAIDLPKTVNQIYELGGLEQLSFRQVVEILAAHMGLHRRMISIPPPYLRAMTVFLEHSFPGFPLSVYWLDYFAVNRTCSMDTLPKQFGLLPTRFAYGLDYLDCRKWGREFWKALFLRRR